MAEKGYDENPRIAYAQKLAEVAARIAQLTEEQRAGFADKIAELQTRKEKLTLEQRAAYDARLKVLTEPKPQIVHTETPVAPQPEPSFVRPEPQMKSQPKAPASRPKPKVAEPEIAPSPQKHVDEEDAYEDEEYEEDYGYEEETTRPKKKKKGRGCLTVFLILLLIAVLTAGIGYWWISGEIKGSRGEAATMTVEVDKGSGPLAIGRDMQEAGVIRSAQIFRFWVREQEGLADKLQYGTFELSSDMSYEELAQALQTTSDNRDTVTVTFPEGIPAVEFAKRLEEAGLCTAQEFLDAANGGDFSDLGFWAKRDENPNQFMACEGYLFPDTYQFFVGDSVENIVRKFYAEFDSKMTDEIYQKIDATGMTLSQFMTLASIVQEEAGGVAHQADVAAIFMNRLAEGSPVTLLQSNCSSYIQNENDNNYLFNTVAWYYGDWSQIPAEIIAAYDTYSTPGLPAGPISNPGVDAIQNTLRYAESEYYGAGYYFFVTDTDGNYYFNQTAAAHEAQCTELRNTGKMAG